MTTKGCVIIRTGPNTEQILTSSSQRTSTLPSVPISCIHLVKLLVIQSALMSGTTKVQTGAKVIRVEFVLQVVFIVVQIDI